MCVKRTLAQPRSANSHWRCYFTHHALQSSRRTYCVSPQSYGAILVMIVVDSCPAVVYDMMSTAAITIPTPMLVGQVSPELGHHGHKEPSVTQHSFFLEQSSSAEDKEERKKRKRSAGREKRWPGSVEISRGRRDCRSKASITFFAQRTFSLLPFISSGPKEP